MRSYKAYMQCRYNFTRWAVSLNTMTPGLAKLLPPSDMRWRRDVRALEAGKYEQVQPYAILAPFCKGHITVFSSFRALSLSCSPHCTLSLCNSPSAK